jgi:HEAT repeat protein
VLSEHVPEHGTPDDIPYWSSHRQAEIDRLLAWWKDEMGGKHNNVPSAAEQAALIRTLGAAGKTGASRNPAEVALFSPAVTVRRAAIAILGESPTADDIPYLDLTLRDPDAGVAYGAYALLWRLLHLPGTAVPLAHFRTHWQQDSDPERHWWWDEMNA